MALKFDSFKQYIKALFSDHEGTESDQLDVPEMVNRLTRHIHGYDWREMSDTAANQHVRRDAQTISLSASQPLARRVIFAAPGQRVRVRAVRFSQYVSSTVTASGQICWNLLVTKLGRGLATGSTSLTSSWSTSTSAFVAGLTSCSTKNTTLSHSLSALTSNVAHAPNPCHLSSTAANLLLGRNDVLTAAVTKGSGTATDAGAIFRGGRIQVDYTEED